MMKGKIMVIPFRRPSEAGEYYCADGEIEKLTNALVEDEDAGGNPADEEPGVAGEDGLPGAENPGDKQQEYASPLHGFKRPVAEFALRMGVVPGWHNHPANFPAREVAAKSPSEEGWAATAMDFLADLQTAAAKASLFVEPFFVMTAMRLADGEYVLPSEPVLMLPNTAVAVAGGNRNLEVASMTLKGIVAACSLEWRLKLPDDFSPSAWGVESVDVFVSKPLPLYQRDEDPLGTHSQFPANISVAIDGSGISGRHLLADTSAVQGWIPEECGEVEFTRNLLSSGKFYLVSSVSAVDLKSGEGFTPVEFNRGIISKLEDSEVYTPHYAHLSGIRAGYKTHFSGRDTYADITFSLPPISVPGAVLPFVGDENEDALHRMGIEVESVKAGSVVRGMRVADSTIYIGETGFPEWIFYPDPDARKMRISTHDGTFSVNLRRHPAMHGAYYWCGNPSRVVLSERGVSVSAVKLGANVEVSESYGEWHDVAAVWRSEKGSRLLLPDNLLMHLDVEKVVALCRAFRASGLVSTTSSTAYLFTSEGVYLVKEMEDGSLRDAGLISRHVLRDAESILMGDTSLTFVAADGVLYKIEGTVVKSAAESASGASGTSSQAVIIIRSDGSGKAVEVATRAMKLGDAESLKKISGVALRGCYGSGGATLEVYGSRNLRDWQLIASRRGGEVSGMWGPAVKFVKVKAVAHLQDGDSIEGIVFRI